MSTPSPQMFSSSIMCSRAERLRLRPWLEKMVEEQAIPGLDWIDDKTKTLRIPWKHAARHGWSRDKDASLFKEWAIHTSKFAILLNIITIFLAILPVILFPCLSLLRWVILYLREMSHLVIFGHYLYHKLSVSNPRIEPFSQYASV